MGRPRGIGPLCLWPGLTQIHSGQWARGILLCAATTVLVNASLVFGWIWTDLLPRQGLLALWSGAGVFWLGATGATLWGSRHRELSGGGDLGAEHRQALEHYLARRWREAEECLGEILRRTPGDCAALLQLGTLYRRQGRSAEAAKVLHTCRSRDVQGKWAWELARESERLASA